MVKLPPPIWMMIYLIVAAAISWALGWPWIPGLPMEWTGVAIFFAGCAPAVWAFVLFRRAGTEIDPTSETNQQLVIAGPYRFTRNPMYLGLVIAGLGLVVWIGDWPFLAVPLAVFATANWVHIPFEEAEMRRQFGAEFDAYARRVRRWV